MKHQQEKSLEIADVVICVLMMTAAVFAIKWMAEEIKEVANLKTIHESVTTRQIKCFDSEMQPIDCSCINIKTERYNHVWVE